MSFPKQPQNQEHSDLAGRHLEVLIERNELRAQLAAKTEEARTFRAAFLGIEKEQEADMDELGVLRARVAELERQLETERRIYNLNNPDNDGFGGNPRRNA